MKRLIFTVLSVVCMAMSVMAQNIDYSRGTRFRMKNSFPVKGGEGIEQFYMALLPGLHTFYVDKSLAQLQEDNEGEFVIDKKNGYISYFQEGAGSTRMQCCYWNRKDGVKLVGFFYDEHNENPEKQRMEYDSFLQFYTYNTTLKCLEAIRDPWDEELSGMVHMMAKLPQQGKDFTYRWGLEENEGAWKTMKWNGLDFRKTAAAPSKTLRAGQHMLSLQWIEDVKYGSCKITPTSKAGEYTISGEHCSKDKSNYLKINGVLTVVDSKRLSFNGTIRTRIYHINNGNEVLRKGNYDFVAEGQRKYWRMQQEYNSGDGCCDYVDIYF